MLRIFAFLLSLSLSVSADPLQLDLQTSLKTAVAHSPRLAESQARLREARGKVDEAYVPAYPKLSLTGNYTRNDPGVAVGGQVFTPVDNYQAALVLDQALYTFGRLRWGTATAELAEKSAQEAYRVQVETLFEEVATTYSAVTLAEEAVTIAQDRVRAQQEQLTASTQLAEAGVVARFDVIRSEAELSRVRQVEIQAQTEVKLARDRLLTRLGLPVGQDLRVMPNPLPGPPPTDVDSASQQALQLRPEMGVLRFAVDSAQARVRFEDSQDAPTLALQSSTFQRNVTGFNPGTQTMTGLILSIPLFDGGLAESRVEQARAVVDQLVQQQESTRREVLLEVRESFNTLRNNWDKIDVADQTVAQSREALRVANLRYRAGLSTNVELLSAQTDFSQARYSLARSHYDYLAAWARWQRVISADYPISVPGPVERQPVSPPAPLYPQAPTP